MLFSLYSFSFRFYAVNVPLHWASERIYERRWISMAFNHTTHSTVYSMYRPYIVKCTTNDYYLHTPRLEDNAMPYLSLRISFLAHIFPKICSQITERMGKNRKGCIDFFCVDRYTMRENNISNLSVVWICVESVDHAVRLIWEKIVKAECYRSPSFRSSRMIRDWLTPTKSVYLFEILPKTSNLCAYFDYKLLSVLL